MRTFRLFAGAAMLSLLSAPTARAGSLYVFGDSLSDNGNIYKLIGYPAAPYYQGHFSNGPIWVEYLPGLTGLSFSASHDYAYGGAFTGDLTIAGTDEGTNIVAASLPGISTEIADFTAAGGSFSSSDVVTLWGGANNYFAYAQAVEADPANVVSLVTNGVTTTITQLTQDTSALIGLGARMLIVPNMPGLGLTPEFNTSALGIELGNAFSDAHNEALPAAMQMLHAGTGANIIILNTQTLLNRVVANPSLYGFTNVTDECLTTPSCVNGSAATQSSYLFWDDVHPTTHAQEMIAEYAADSLRGFEALTVPARLGTNAAQSFSTVLNTRLNALQSGASGASYSINGVNGGVADASHKIGLFVSVTGDFGNRESKGFNLGYRYHSAVTAIGLDARLTDNITAGLAVAYANSHADVSGGGTVRDEGADLGAYALATSGDAYAKFTAGYDFDNYDTSAPGVLGNIKASPAGHTLLAGAAIGLKFHPLNQLSIGPELGINYTNAKISSYTQSGDSLLTQTVGAQSFKQLIGTTAVNAATSLQIGGFSFAPYASAGAQFLMAGQDGTFTSAFTDEPVLKLTSTYPHQPGCWAIFSAGASTNFGQRLSANIGISTTAFKSDGDDLQISGSARWSF